MLTRVVLGMQVPCHAAAAKARIVGGPSEGCRAIVGFVLVLLTIVLMLMLELTVLVNWVTPPVLVEVHRALGCVRVLLEVWRVGHTRIGQAPVRVPVARHPPAVLPVLVAHRPLAVR